MRKTGVGAVVASFLVVIGLVAACAGERPKAGSDERDRQSTGAAQCVTPNEGCPCDEPGKLVECGKVKYQSGDYVACQMGKRTCAGGRWGACTGTDIVTKSFVAGAPLRGLALGTGAACPTDPADPLSNVCDPYCNHFVDDPSGLVVDGGLVVTPEGGLTVGGYTDGGIGTGLQTTGSGTSTCGAASNVQTSPCNASPLTSCCSWSTVVEN